jgi:two-component system, chemotaxis family, chemotaxis protein CheY
MGLALQEDTGQLGVAGRQGLDTGGQKGQSMRALVVDDSLTMRKIERRVLSSMGVEDVVEAGDGFEALDLVERSPTAFNVMLIDLNLPYMDGLTLVRRIRERDRGTPILVVSTDGERTRILDALRVGATHYVVKPFTSDGLLNHIRWSLSNAMQAERRKSPAEA